MRIRSCNFIQQCLGQKIGNPTKIYGTNSVISLQFGSHDLYRKTTLNKTIHIINGNILNAKNLSLLQFNKGPSFIERVIPALENLMDTHKPSICALSEANVAPQAPPRVCGKTHPALSGYNWEVSEPTPGFDRGGQLF